MTQVPRVLMAVEKGVGVVGQTAATLPVARAALRVSRGCLGGGVDASS